jgi:pantoate--beta-alanine ligase
MMLRTFESWQALRGTLLTLKQQGKSIGLVPTMGNLHAGHIKLVQQARLDNDVVVTSIFVNPLQFGAGEDLESYPRTLAADQALLEDAGCDFLLSPPVTDFYPDGQQTHTRIKVPVVSEGLCGESRPIHFEGVATVVTKLLNMVGPDRAYFGKKDYQQLMVIKKLVADLCLPVAIQGVDTVRDSDGLALSSRNGYLTEKQRVIAPHLHAVLNQVAERLKATPDEWQATEVWGINQLVEAGLKPDYLEVREAETLARPRIGCCAWVILSAVHLGKTRLIDNLEVALNRSKD